jgi:hypothetical protein
MVAAEMITMVDVLMIDGVTMMTEIVVRAKTMVVADLALPDVIEVMSTKLPSKRNLLDICTDFSTGSFNTRGRGGGSRGGLQRGSGGRGGLDGNESISSGSSASQLPPLPASAPFPEGTGAEIPYVEHTSRGTTGRQIMVLTNHHVIQCLPVIKIYQ